MTDTTNPAVAAGLAAAQAIAPEVAVAAGIALGQPALGVLGAQVLSQGLAYYSAYAAKLAAGQIALAVVEEAAAKTGVDLAQLAADVNAQPAVG